MTTDSGFKEGCEVLYQGQRWVVTGIVLNTFDHERLQIERREEDGAKRFVQVNPEYASEVEE